MDHVQAAGEVARHIFWSLVLQGIAFLMLAVLILLYPALLFALVSVMFFFMGLMLLTIAFRLRGVWRKLPKFLKEGKL